jgi:protein-disulfide isomerase-like protein with CxxC motif
MVVAPLARVAISIHLAAGQQPWSFHGYAAANTLLAPGDQTTAPDMTSVNAMQRRFLVSGIDVTSARPLRSVVALGDSITDGVRATVDPIAAGPTSSPVGCSRREWLRSA